MHLPATLSQPLSSSPLPQTPSFRLEISPQVLTAGHPYQCSSTQPLKEYGGRHPKVQYKTFQFEQVGEIHTTGIQLLRGRRAHKRGLHQDPFREVCQAITQRRRQLIGEPCIQQ